LLITWKQGLSKVVEILNAEIKTRIEMINKGEVPEGYKKTKVGIIPEDWEETRLDKVSKITMGQSPSSANYNENGIGLPLIQGNADIKDRYTSPRLFTSEITKICEVDDIIMSVRAPVGEIAKSVHKACIGRGVCSIRPVENNYYLYHYLINSERLWTRYSQGSTFESVNSSDIKKFKVISPKSIKEQQKIAQILSTWDQAIELKEKLIEEKKEQKKGLMQKLLTGEVRLAGFDGEWEEVRLGDIGEFSTSSVNKKIEEGERIINLVNYMDVYNNNFIDNSIDYMKVSASESQISKFSLKIGDVLFTPSSETADDIGHSAVVKIDKKNLLYSYHLVRLRFNKEIDINFKGYVFNNKNVLREFTRLASYS
jgi:type I restriction enzyme S subunit